jgi:hypothetical protein
MRKTLSYIFDECVETIEALACAILGMLILITFPIWVIPYLVYKHKKGKRGNK